MKACLAYGKLSYKVIEVNPLTKSEIKSFEYSKVPILTLNEEKLYGSDKIVERLLEKNLKITSDSPSAKKWTNFAKEELAPLLYPNLCSSLSNSYKAFEYVHSVDSFSTLQKYSIQSVGSLAMYMAASKIKSE